MAYQEMLFLSMQPKRVAVTKADMCQNRARLEITLKILFNKYISSKNFKAHWVPYGNSPCNWNHQRKKGPSLVE